MCGIFGAVSLDKSKGVPSSADLKKLAIASERRGKDSSGFLVSGEDSLTIYRADRPVSDLIDRITLKGFRYAIGHSRLITNSTGDNQPISRYDMVVVHNGIITNVEEEWRRVGERPLQDIDTEVVLGVANYLRNRGVGISSLAKEIVKTLKGTASCALTMPKDGKIVLFTNNGSLYTCNKDGVLYFASEYGFIEKIGGESISNVGESGLVIEIEKSDCDILVNEIKTRNQNFVPALGSCREEEAQLRFRRHNLRRCSRCVLPETMPYISFNEDGVCNYCLAYKPRNQPKPLSELAELVEPYKSQVNVSGANCIVPFSGGRDSSFGLHIIRDVLDLKPITYTYDWGMVTDLARRNISRMCAELGVENIIVAANIEKKRRNIRKNLTAWLKKPDLGMVSILTAGDKHFYRHIKTIQRETGIGLNLWSVNPLEVTYFKAGFLGVPPDFTETKVYTSKLDKQLFYQKKRFKAMLGNPGYFNRSVIDTLSGEYYRSISTKKDYFHTFDYYKWDEDEINNLLIGTYDWEVAPDTDSTWRIGDGTAAMYNYIYYTVAGFTEHDTFRSNQIREGQITREKALELVEIENRPRYPNIKWYLDAIQLDFTSTIKRINEFALQEIE